MADDRRRIIREACLDRCDTMTSGSYDFGGSLSAADRVLTIVIAAVGLALMYLGAAY